jgi:hypothetical protein
MPKYNVETAETDYATTLRHPTEEQDSHLHCGGNLETRTVLFVT